MKQDLKILILEDVPTDADLVEHALRKEKISFESLRVDTKEAFLDGLTDFMPDLILSDYMLPQFTGMEALMIAKEHSPQIPFIVVTGSINEETAVDCIKAGAWDYVTKDHLSRLGPAIKGSLVRREFSEKIQEAESTIRKLSRVVEQSPVTIMITDTDGRIEYVNPYFTEVTGYSAEEAIGHTPNILKSGEHSGEFYRQLWDTITSGKVWRGEIHNIKKNGEHYW